MALERLQVILELVAGQYKREAREAATATGRISDKATQASRSTGTLQGRMIGFGSVMKGAAVTGAILTAGRAVGDAIDRAERMTSAYAVTEQVIRQTGGAANVTAEDIKRLSREEAILTGVDKALIQEGNNVILTFKNIRNEVGEGNNIFDRTSALMLDVSTVMGNSAPAAAKQLAKALNDPIGQLGALAEAGLTFTDQQEEQIKTLARSGDLLGAQKIILAELESQLGGTAAASADASDKISNALAEISEAGGTLLLPLVDTLAIELQTMTGALDEWDRLAAITGQERGSAGLLAGALHKIATEAKDVDKDFDDATGGTRAFRAEAERLIDTSGATSTELAKVRDGLDFMVESMGLSEEAAGVLHEVITERLAAGMTDLEKRARESAGGVEQLSDAAGADRVLHQYAAGIDAIGDELKTAVPDAQAMANAIAAVNQAALEAANPIFGAVSAYQRYEKTLEAVNEDGKVTAEESLELAAAALEANAAIASLGSGNLQAGIQAIADALGQPYGVIVDILEQVGILDGTEINLLFRASMPAADRALLNSVNTATSGGGSSVTKTIDAGIANVDIGRQHGGPFRRHQLLRVGEENKPELMLIPGDQGRIFSNSDSRALIAALNGGRGSEFNINLEGTGDPVIDAQRVGHISSVLRRMETRR